MNEKLDEIDNESKANAGGFRSMLWKINFDISYRKNSLFFIFEIEKMFFHSLDLNPSVLGNHDSAPKDFFPDSTNKSTPAKAYSSKNVFF